MAIHQVISLSIPGLTSTSPFIYVAQGYGTDDDHQIGISQHMEDFMAQWIISQEMTIMRRENPTIQYDKLQEMINSDDSEMNDLAYNILEKHTKYTVPMLKGIKDCYSISSWISSFVTNNRLNITDKIL